MKITSAFVCVAAAIVAVAATGDVKICPDSSPDPTTPTVTPQPTTLEPTTPAPTTPAPTTPEPTTSEPTTPTATVAPTACGPLLPNTTFTVRGEIIANGYDVDGCCALCSATPGCRAFTHSTSESICRLWYSKAALVPTPSVGLVSSVMISTKSCQLLPVKTKLTGHTYAESSEYSVEGCCTKCSLDGATCKGYAYDTQRTRCYYFDPIDGQTTVGGWVSGLNY